MEPNPTGEPDGRSEFSLITGGPVYRFLIASGLIDHPIASVHRLILGYIVIAWLPLLAMSLHEGTFWNPSLKLCLALDFELHIRFFLVMPLLLVGEQFAHRELLGPLRLLRSPSVLPEKDQPLLEAIFRSAARIRDSSLAEILLLAAVFTLGHAHWKSRVLGLSHSWYVHDTPAGRDFLPAGLWYAWVSIPIFQFTFYRWVLRFVAWGRLLFGVSRLDLQFEPTHPDRMGGLEFIMRSAHAFAPFLLAVGTLIAAVAGGEILSGQSTLDALKVEIAITIAVAVALPLLPLTVFVLPVFLARRKALGQYDALARRYSMEFRMKWIEGGAGSSNVLIGSSDVQSLADMAGSYDVIREMGAFKPIRNKALQLLAITAVPVAPLLLTVVSPEVIAGKLMSLLF